MERNRPGWTQMNIKIPLGLQRELRLLAALHERTMSAQIRFLVEQAVRKELKSGDR